MGREVGSSIQEIEIGSEMAPRERLRYALKRGSCQGRQQRRPEAPPGRESPRSGPQSPVLGVQGEQVLGTGMKRCCRKT